MNQSTSPANLRRFSKGSAAAAATTRYRYRSPEPGRNRYNPTQPEARQLLDELMTESEGLARNSSLASAYAGSF